MRRGGSTGKSGEKGGRIMAERRMFAKTIVLSDAFLDLPLGTRCLYFTLGMVADDDGFINSPKAVMRQCGSSEDDLKLLIAKRFVLAFPSGVVVIKHWKINNYLRNDRYNETKYTEEKSQLVFDENGAYTEIKSNGIPNNGIPSIGQYRLGKDSIGKCIDSPRASEETPETGVKTHLFEIPTVEKVTAYCKTKGYTIDAERFIAWGERTEWCINGQRIRSWQSVADAWQKRAQSKEPQTYTESSFDVDEFLDAALTASRCR